MSADVEMHAEGVAAVGQNEAWNPKVLAFLCNWCSYAGADLAGISRTQYPPNVRIVRVPCSGRVNPLYIIKALQSGADGVLVSGCHPGDCHYISGNYYARRRFTLLRSLLEAVGIEPGRVNFSWVSAAEGEKFSQVVTDVVARVRELGPAKRLVKGAPGGSRTNGSSRTGKLSEAKE
jgi:coenzyme F420-reducing hydrogenase delta subunit